MHTLAGQACNRPHVIIVRTLVSDPALHIEASSRTLVDEGRHLFSLGPHNVEAYDCHDDDRHDEQNGLPFHWIHPPWPDQFVIEGSIAAMFNYGCLPNVFQITPLPIWNARLANLNTVKLVP